MPAIGRRLSVRFAIGTIGASGRNPMFSFLNPKNKAAIGVDEQRRKERAPLMAELILVMETSAF